MPEDVKRARLVAFYLPQFHPAPENDAWWGEGFTEWTNVAKAKPLFLGHYQPHIPANLGFCDLRLDETRAAQSDLARRHLIEGFCYWHYWFNGKRLLSRPFDEVLTSGRPDFPFCLCWANETWSRRWLGEDKDILMKQTYSLDDDVSHARWLTEVFADPRYIRLQGRPLFLIYRPTDLPLPQRTTDIFREQCLRVGVAEPYLVGVNAHAPDVDCRSIGFDETLNFEPQLGVLPTHVYDGASLSRFLRNIRLGVPSARLKVYDCELARHLMAKRMRTDIPLIPCVFVGWDNSPRRGTNGIIMVNANPQDFALSLSKAVLSVRDRPYDERLVFINAWNEWAEGNHLEPDLRYGLAYLEAVRRANAIGEKLGHR